MSKLKEARLSAGLTQAKMSELMKIPMRTIQHWEGGTRQCPIWAEELILAELARIKERNEQ